MTASCGIDWADDHHDVAVVDEDGKLIGKRRITDDADGLEAILQLLADCATPHRIRYRWPSRTLAACCCRACGPPAA
jgi:predicted NBD/HSP70 family sugar kinase